MGWRSVLLDIEGTTTPIAFVYEVLFPYARARLREYVHDPGNRAALVEPAKRLNDEYAEDCSADLPLRSREATTIALDVGTPSVNLSASGDALVAYAEWLMDRDRKSPGLKLLQGLIWEHGYRNGELQGEVFPDVPVALKQWNDAGVPVAIYSSGSELAQRLLFSTTAYGDLTSCISRFFDTSIGPKVSSDSYRRIAAELACDPRGILFVSDVTPELDAATLAGCETRLCIRPGNHPQAPNAYTTVTSLDELRQERTDR